MTDGGSGKKRKPWAAPVLRRIELTDEEIEALRASSDPVATLREMKPILKLKARI